MEAYNSLATFPDVAVALEDLALDPDIEAYVFSNGSDEMVASSVRESPGLGPYQDVFKGIVTVEDVRSFKPDRNVYEHFLRKAGKEHDVAGTWLVSSNPFDVVGAKAVGIKGKPFSLSQDPQKRARYLLCHSSSILREAISLDCSDLC